MRDYLAGIDVGTTGTKVTIYNRKGEKLDNHYVEYSLSTPQQYWVELNPYIWWEAVCHSFKEIFNRTLVSPKDIKAIGVSSTNALVLLDKNDALVRPAIMQLDQRSMGLLDKISRDIGDEYVVGKTKNRIACGAFWGPTILWLKYNRPLELKKVTKLMTPHSFINYKLTGIYSIDPSRASTTMLFDVENELWDPLLCNYFGIKEKNLPQIHHTLDIIGGITKEAAEMTGLHEGTPIISGCMDSLAGHIGTGAKNTDASLILGSVGRICFNTIKTDPRFMNIKNSVQSSLFSMTPTNSTGISYKWIKEVLYDKNTSKQTNIYFEMDELANKSPIGAKGMIYHPYIAGERSPIWNPKATGSFFGITTEHKREDFIRAVLEGVGYSLAHNYKIVHEEMRLDFECLHASGGGAKSDVWLQTLSNILGKPIKAPQNSDSETLGMAILAGTAIGVFKELQEGIEEAVSFRKEYLPDQESYKIYQKYLKAYIMIYQTNKDLYETMKDLSKEAVPIPD